MRPAAGVEQRHGAVVAEGDQGHADVADDGLQVRRALLALGADALERLPDLAERLRQRGVEGAAAGRRDAHRGVVVADAFEKAAEVTRRPLGVADGAGGQPDREPGQRPGADAGCEPSAQPGPHRQPAGPAGGDGERRQPGDQAAPGAAPDAGERRDHRPYFSIRR